MLHSIFLSKTRYGDKLTYEINGLEDYQDMVIPKLVLQPLVENAIYHGIKEVDRIGIIRVSLSEDQEHLLISVWDNGQGMSFDAEANSQHLLERGGVGLKNVDQRLRLHYGKGYYMSINSQADAFTEIVLHLPKESLKQN